MYNLFQVWSLNFSRFLHHCRDICYNFSNDVVTKFLFKEWVRTVKKLVHFINRIIFIQRDINKCCV